MGRLHSSSPPGGVRKLPRKLPGSGGEGASWGTLLQLISDLTTPGPKLGGWGRAGRWPGGCGAVQAC